MLKKMLAVLLAVALLLAVAVPVSAQVYDDTRGHWAKTAIDRWSDYQIVVGDGTSFRPDDPMNRAEYSVVLSKLLKLVAESPSGTFSDVPDGHWYTHPVFKASAARLMVGNTWGQFLPKKPITREQAIVVLARALGMEPDPDPDTTLAGFSDAASVSDWAKPYVAAMVKAGYVAGESKTLLGAQHFITRASIMQLLNASITYYVNEDGTVEVPAGIKGVVLVVADNVTVKAAGDVRIVVAKPGANVSLAGSTGRPQVVATANDVTVTDAPGGAQVTAAAGVTGVTANGQPVEPGTTVTIEGESEPFVPPVPASKATFAAGTAETVWGQSIADMQSDLAAVVNGTTVKFTGTLKPVAGWAGFAGDENLNTGFFAYFKVEPDTATLAEIKDVDTTVATLKGDLTKTFTGAQLTDGTEPMEFILQVVNKGSTAKKQFTLKLDWDGDGDKYTATTYTLDFSGVKLDILTDLQAKLNAAATAENKTVTLDLDVTIEAGETLTIPAGVTLKTGDFTITNNGTLYGVPTIGDDGEIVLGANSKWWDAETNPAIKLYGTGKDGSIYTITSGTVTMQKNTGSNDADEPTVTIAGDVTVNSSTGSGGRKEYWKIASGTLTIPEGVMLTIGSTDTLENNGTITNNGTIINSGTITNNGTVTGLGTVTTKSGGVWEGNVFAWAEGDANQDASWVFEAGAKGYVGASSAGALIFGQGQGMYSIDTGSIALKKQGTNPNIVVDGQITLNTGYTWNVLSGEKIQISDEGKLILPSGSTMNVAEQGSIPEIKGNGSWEINSGAAVTLAGIDFYSTANSAYLQMGENAVITMLAANTAESFNSGKATVQITGGNVSTQGNYGENAYVIQGYNIWEIGTGGSLTVKQGTTLTIAQDGALKTSAAKVTTSVSAGDADVTITENYQTT